MSQSEARRRRRQIERECKRYGHLWKTGDPKLGQYCARCGEPKP